MNLIECKYEQTQYWSEPHPCVFIDDQRLDLLVDSLSAKYETKDLLPTLFSALDEHSGAEIVWQRVLPSPDSESILPILMCPDDLDLHCTVVVTRVSNDHDTIRWSGFGLDQSNGGADVGSEVIWFSEKQFTFSLQSYNKMMIVFKQERLNKYVENSDHTISSSVDSDSSAN